MRMINKIFFLLLILFIVAGCGTNENSGEKESEKIIVYTTVFPLEDFTKKIGGDYVEVKSIYPPGVDEHTYEPSQKTIIDLAKSDIFFYIGFGLEAFVNKVEPILDDEGVTTVAIGESIELDLGQIEEEDDHHDEEAEDEHHHHDINPHLWLDPLYSKQMAETILQYLVETSPEHKDYFEKNYQTLAEQFDLLHEEMLEVATNSKIKSFVVSHAAYDYWELRYGLEQLSISGISTTEEPSQKKLLSIIKDIKEKNLNYVLMEQNVNSKLVEVVQKEANIKVLPIHNLAILTEDDLKDNKDYFSIMRDNIEVLKTVLNE